MGDGYYEHMVDEIKFAVLKDGNFSSLVHSVLEADAEIVKGAEYRNIRNSSIFEATNIEESLGRMRIVVGAWCVVHPDPIAFTPGALA